MKRIVRTHLHSMIEALQAGRLTSAFDLSDVSDSAYGGKHVALKTLARRAICFYVGDCEELPWVSKPTLIPPALLRLPYPDCWFEWFSHDGQPIAYLINEIPGKNNCDDPAWLFHGFEKHNSIGWVNVSRGVNWVGTAADVDVLHAPGGVTYSGHVEPTRSSVITNFAADLKPEYRAAGFKHEMERVAFLHLGVCFMFLMALNCTNTRTQKHDAPRRLNKSRQKKNKPPINEYWTLEIDDNSSQHSELGGTHASPRLHLRRGHIREFAPNQFTWVRPCVVGDRRKGIITKNYAMATK